ncbi:MAG: phosphotransferase [Microbacterium sp.]
MFDASTGSAQAAGSAQATGSAQTALASFDGVGRGDPAPPWVQRGIIAAWGLPDDAEVTLIVLSENITFKASVDGSPRLVIRLGRPGYAESLEHVRSELIWVDALKHDVGVPTPAPVPGVNGDFVQLLSFEGQTWTAVAFEFVTGTMLEDQSGFEHHFTEIGRLTAALHDHAREWRSPSGFVRFSWTPADMVGAAARWGDWRDAALPENDRALLERAETSALAALDGSGVGPSNPGTWGLIHADLRPSNVMTHGDELSIIDFDDCGYSWFLYDFAAALTFYEHRSEALEMAAGWLDGYREVTRVSPSELDAAASLSMLRRLTMLGWQTTHREDALPPDLWNENQPGTVEVAARYLADPLWLVRG